jgi:cyclopropane fatty-acyl-phospholipid synthase-like methyltransferase
MQPANDPNIDYIKLVQRGYDRCAGNYDQARQREPEPALDVLIELLEPGNSVLDLGCGAGVPVARTLSQHFVVTGVDISEEQIRRAQQNAPSATFTQGDMLSITFPPATFDAVVAFYSIFHTQREEHFSLFQRIHQWLRPGGYLLATFAFQAEEAYTEANFFGTTMFWSNYSVEEYQTMLQRANFDVLNQTILGHGYEGHQVPSEQHPLILARSMSVT